MADGSSAFENELGNSQSPYLQQHKDNPVHWMEWSQRAFQRAETQQKPIFLSSGYSSCHWCHVMAHEAFEDAEVAAYLNEHFVSVKLDREERPDVDSIYMTFLQSTNEGRGGWPMSVFLTPDRSPFYAGTYYPKRQFMALLKGIVEAWRDKRADIERSASSAVEGLREIAGGGSSSPHASPGISGGHVVSTQALAPRFLKQLRSQFDRKFGGFGHAPKFPTPSQMLPLVSLSIIEDESSKIADMKALDMSPSCGKLAQLDVSLGAEPSARLMLVMTLRALATGGIFDHVGGGFARYSVDRYWHIPHFEKMLYDQGQILSLMADAYRVSGADATLEHAMDLSCEYLLRDMRDGATGMFYSAEDADSLKPGSELEKGEGAFYLFPESEIREALSSTPNHLQAFLLRYGVRREGNIKRESDPHGEFQGLNHLYLAMTPGDVAAQLRANNVCEASAELVLTWCDECLTTLRTWRTTHRTRPFLDNKCLAAWNGLIISGLARVGAVLGRHSAIEAAQEAAAGLKRFLYSESEQQLYRVYRTCQRGATRGLADDYAFVVQGLLDLYSTTLDPGLLLFASTLQTKMNEKFFSFDAQAWYATEAEQEDLFVRTREEHDGAEPAPTSVGLRNCIRLQRLLGDSGGSQNWTAVIEAVRRNVLDQRSMFARTAGHVAPCLLRGLLETDASECSVVVVGERSAMETMQMLRAFHTIDDPFATILLLDPSGVVDFVRGRDWLRSMLDTYKAGDTAVAYVCEGTTCQPPARHAVALQETLCRVLSTRAVLHSP